MSGPAAGARASAVDAEPSRSASQYRLYEQVGHLLRRAHQRASSIFMEQMTDHGLTPLQFAALVSIRDHGQVSQNALGRATAMDPATIHGVTSRLKERGLVRAWHDPDDRRRTLLGLTQPGLTLLSEAVVTGQTVTDLTLQPLSAKEQKMLLALLKKVG